MASAQLTPIANLLSTNAQWAQDVDKAEPGFFKETVKGQKPKVLWFGCADSRVPESVITGAKPGDIFVHRNIANQFHLDDDSALSVLTYAVDHLGVQHVVIVGHSECGGAAACYKASGAAGYAPDKENAIVAADESHAPINRFLSPLTALAYSLQLSTLAKEEAIPLLVDENVKSQVANLAKSATITNAWAKGKEVYVHGLVYDLGSGTLKDLGVTQGPPKSA